jgi:hypothetical protein
MLPSHGVQILPAQTAINKADDVSQHDRTPLFDQQLSERIFVSGQLRRLRKMVSSQPGFLGTCARLSAKQNPVCSFANL